MVPFVASRNPKISRVTVGFLEDLGYSVNYDAADSFQANDFGPACQCRRRLSGDTLNLSEELSGDILHPKTSTSRRTLSDAGRQKAIALGRNYLASLPWPPLEGRDGQDGPQYHGDSLNVTTNKMAMFMLLPLLRTSETNEKTCSVDLLPSSQRFSFSICIVQQ